MNRALLVLLLVARVAHADDKPWAAGVAPAEQEAALALYRAGNAEFEESRYAQALAKYREAVKHWDHPAIRFNMAVSLVNLDQPLEAYEDLEAAMKFGEAPLGADGYAQAVTYKKLLDGQLTHLRVTCDVPDAEVTLDGKSLLHGTGEATRLLLPGEHQVVASKQGFETETSTLVLVPGKELVHPVKLVRLEARTHLERRWSSSTPWIVLGSGAGLALAGGVLEIMARGEYQTYDQLLIAQCGRGCGPNAMVALDPSTTSHKSTGHAENIAGVSLLVVGGAVAVTGLVGVYLNQPRTVLEHAPIVTPLPGGGAAVSTSWSW